MPPPTHPDDLEVIVQRLSGKRAEWAAVPIAQKRALLEDMLRGVQLVAERWVEAAAQAKRLERSDARAGEEWLSGPMPVVHNLRMLIDAFAANGEPKPARVHVRSDGRTVARVFPLDRKHRVLLGGVTAEVWMAPGKPASQGAKVKSPPARGHVCAVLGAGNISAIPAMDALYKLFVEGEVVVLKMNPLNAAVGPHIETAFRALIEAGYFAVVYGGGDVGTALVTHPLVESLHVTGSDATYDAIVFGTDPEERARRKSVGDGKNKRPFTAELGCVTPVLVAPGPYSRAHLDYQARHVAAMLTHNGGFNCDAAQVVVVAREWLQRETFLTLLRDELRKIPPRAAWSPGAAQRHAEIAHQYPKAELLSAPQAGTLPWMLIPRLEPTHTAAKEPLFRREAFCGALAVVELEDVSDAPAYFEKAVAFANDRLWGTLSMTMIVHPTTLDEHRVAVERAIAELRYGVVAVNAWAGVVFALAGCTWGAFPGHEPHDIQSGTGVVHNALLFDHPEKTVVVAPFITKPPPPYFPNLEGVADLGRALLAFEADPTWGGVVSVARAGMRVKRKKDGRALT